MANIEQLEEIRAKADMLAAVADAHPARDLSPAEITRAQELRVEGKSWNATATALGLDPTVVRRQLDPDFAAKRAGREKERWAGQREAMEERPILRGLQRAKWRERQALSRAEKKPEEPSGGAGRGGGRGLPYLGKSRGAYFAKEDSMGDVVRFADVRHSADSAVARMDAYAQNRGRQDTIKAKELDHAKEVIAKYARMNSSESDARELQAAKKIVEKYEDLERRASRFNEGLRGDATRQEKYQALRKGATPKPQKEGASQREEVTDANGVTFDGKVAYFAGGIFRRGSFARPKSGGFGMFKGRRVFFIDKIKVSGGIVTAYGLIYENGLDDKSPVERYYPVSELIPSPPLR